MLEVSLPPPMTEEQAKSEAASLAYFYKGIAYGVYTSGAQYYVLLPGEEATRDLELICFAQFWSDNTVQLRYRGARSEWRNF